MDTAAIVTCVRNFPHHRGSIVGALLLHRACHICSMLEMLLSCNKDTEMGKDRWEKATTRPAGRNLPCCLPLVRLPQTSPIDCRLVVHLGRFTPCSKPFRRTAV